MATASASRVVSSVLMLPACTAPCRPSAALSPFGTADGHAFAVLGRFVPGVWAPVPGAGPNGPTGDPGGRDRPSRDGVLGGQEGRDGHRPNGGHVPGNKGSGSVALARPWSPAAGRRLGAAGVTLVVLSAVACTSAGGSGPGASASPSSAAASSSASSAALPSSGAASSLEQQYEQVVGRVLPSVVQISTSEGSGSGVVYDTKGDIVTNAHVVGTATALQVGLASGGKPLAATVVGVFAPDDLAVIRVHTGPGRCTRRRSAARPRYGSVRSCWPWATRSA